MSRKRLLDHDRRSRRCWRSASPPVAATPRRSRRPSPSAAVPPRAEAPPGKTVQHHRQRARRPTTAGSARISKDAKAAAAQHPDVEVRAAPGRGRRLAGPADRAGDREEARRPRRAAPGRRGADARSPRRPSGRASRSSTSTGCSPRPTPRRRRSSATTTRSASWRPTTSPTSSSARATSSRSRAWPASRSPTDRTQGLRRRAQEEVPGRRHQDRRPAAG